MQVYLYPIRQAAIIFIGIVFMIMVPFMIVQYRKYGSVSTCRSLILYSFLFYMICAYFLVILPLPARDSVTTSYRDMMQLIPFNFIGDFFRETTLVLSQPSTYLPALMQGVVTQPIFNIIMLIPFGIYLRYYFNRSFKETLILSFCLSLFFELTQLSGLYGIYSGPYRLFDVDDLMLNTLGGVIGFVIAPAITYFFPSRETIDTLNYRKGQRVTYLRRFIAYNLDLMVIGVLTSMLTMAFRAIGITSSTELYVNPLVFFGYFVVFAYINHGRTLMQQLLKIEVTSHTGELKLSQLFLRGLLFYIGIYQGPAVVNSLYTMALDNNAVDLLSTLMYLALTLGWYVFLGIHLVYTAFKQNRELFYERMSKTYFVSTVNE
ncbi:VanZ family protein [Erysipelothrix sp. HDW6C]|uniref:VanZ family protein n=1 Tax=Erysipelothrix sp. HDW6C TaxID=2714930 RepID=UPI00140D9AD7|nr:VanZ family protein [Erysipelothrix sp. HDW6C]QIK69649.1 VanZ family protein [Erysipelothrix sp. HDW6C]